MSEVNNTNSSSQSIALGVYVLYVIGAFSGIFWLGGLILAYVFRGKPGNSQLASKHFEHQVRFGVKLLIVGVVAAALAILLTITLIGAFIAWVPLLVWLLWALVVAVKGLAALVGDREPS